MSTSVLKALPGKLDIKRHSPSILYLLGQDRRISFTTAVSTFVRIAYILRKWWDLVKQSRVITHPTIYAVLVIVYFLLCHVSLNYCPCNSFGYWLELYHGLVSHFAANNTKALTDMREEDYLKMADMRHGFATPITLLFSVTNISVVTRFLSYNERNTLRTKSSRSDEIFCFATKSHHLHILHSIGPAV